MNLNFNWINLLILFGAVQGLIFSIILLFNKKHPGAKFLSAFMFVFAYNGFETFNWSSGLDNYIVFFDLFSFIIIFAGGPSLYLYITTLLNPEEKPPVKTILLHYGVVIFQFIYRLVILIYYILWKTLDYRDEVAAFMFNALWFYAEPLSVLVFIGYVVASILKFRKAMMQQKMNPSARREGTLKYQWIKALLICMVALGIFWPLTLLAPKIFDIPYDVHYYPIEIGLVFFIYWIAFVGYHRTKVIHPQALKASAHGISEQEVQQYLTRLQKAMAADKLYLDPELNLNKLSAHTGINPKNISLILNQHIGKNFNDFVNEYRVKEVKERLVSLEYQHLTISAIALDAGFNSQATFQRAFKSIAGMPPREYVTMQLRNGKVIR
jgi:AraC-like DNA-binding protein